MPSASCTMSAEQAAGGYREKVPMIAIRGYYEGKSGGDPPKAELDSDRECQLAGIRFEVGQG